MKLRTISASTIVFIIITILIFISAFDYPQMSSRGMWDGFIFIFLFLSVISWRLDKLEKKK